MTASTILSFAALAFACVACLILGLIFAYIAFFWRRLNKQLRRDRLTEYKLPAEAMQLTGHRSESAFYRWAASRRVKHIAHGRYRRTALLRALGQ